MWYIFFHFWAKPLRPERADFAPSRLTLVGTSTGHQLANGTDRLVVKSCRPIVALPRIDVIDDWRDIDTMIYDSCD